MTSEEETYKLDSSLTFIRKVNDPSLIYPSGKINFRIMVPLAAFIPVLSGTNNEFLPGARH